MTGVLISFTLFTVNLPNYSYEMTKSDQMWIPDTTSDQIRLHSPMGINFGVQHSKKVSKKELLHKEGHVQEN